MLYRTCFECRITICTLSLCSAALGNIFLSFILKSEDFLEGVSILQGGQQTGDQSCRNPKLYINNWLLLTVMPDPAVGLCKHS